jgi:hypothetical protein
MPRLLQIASISREVSGEVDADTQTTEPFFSRSSRPEWTRTSSTCWSVATITMTTSAFSPTSVTPLTVFTPAAFARASASGSTSKPATSKPLFTMWRAI